MSSNGVDFLSLVEKEDPDEIYELIDEIAVGSYGSVYKSIHLPTKKVVAMKIMEPDEDEELDDFAAEIKVLKDCSHPNIVNYVGAYIKGDEIFIAMEFCDGGQCNDLFKVEEKPMFEPYIKAIQRGTMLALEYMHGLRIVHRDIKAANILCNSDGTVKLADFGVSALLKDRPDGAFTFIGTPYWMAPEVIDNKSASVNPYDMKADIWSMGITAIELAQITPPLSDVHPMRALFQIPLEDSPTLKDKDKWSPAFHEYLAKALQKDPKARASATELLQGDFLRLHGDGVELVRRLIARTQALKAGKTPPVDTLEILNAIAAGGAAGGDGGGGGGGGGGDGAAADAGAGDGGGAAAPPPPDVAPPPAEDPPADGAGGDGQPLTIREEKPGADGAGQLADAAASIAKHEVVPAAGAASKAPSTPAASGRGDESGDDSGDEGGGSPVAKDEKDNEAHAKEVLSKTLRRSTLAREKRPQHRLTAKEEVALAEHAVVRKFQKNVSKEVDKIKQKQAEATQALQKRQEDEYAAVRDKFAAKINAAEAKGEADQKEKVAQLRKDKARVDKEYEDRKKAVDKDRVKEAKDRGKAIASEHKKRAKEGAKGIKADIKAREAEAKAKAKGMPKAEGKAFEKEEKARLAKLAKQLELEIQQKLALEKLSKEQEVSRKHQAETHEGAFEHLSSYTKMQLDKNEEVHAAQTEALETVTRLRVEQREALALLAVQQKEAMQKLRAKQQEEMVTLEEGHLLTMMDMEHKYKSREMVAKIRADTKEFKKQQAKLKKNGTLGKAEFKQQSAKALEAFEASVKERQEAFKKELEEDKKYQASIVERSNAKKIELMASKAEAELKTMKEGHEEERKALELELETTRHTLLARQQHETAALVRRQFEKKRAFKKTLAAERADLIARHTEEALALVTRHQQELEGVCDKAALEELRARCEASKKDLQSTLGKLAEEAAEEAATFDRQLVEQYERLASTITQNQKEELAKADERVVGAGGTAPPRKPTPLEQGLDVAIDGAGGAVDTVRGGGD